MPLKITISPAGLGAAWAQMWREQGERMNRAITAAMNMAASLIVSKGKDDIASAGRFGSSWTDGLRMEIEGASPNMVMYLTHTIPYAGIFETGGTIQGSPLLWIPLSGTDAAGLKASAFPGDLFSAKFPRKSGKPLLFAMSDKQPRYFGTESVTIPKKFRLTEDVTSVMANFRAYFDEAWQKG